VIHKSYAFDNIVLWLIGFVLLYSAVIFSIAGLSGSDIGVWVWDRHQNLFSWYSRPLFIIPAAYYAYRHKPWHVIGCMSLLGTSLFWFPAPAQVSAAVTDYLEWEKQLFFINENRLPLIAMSLAVVVFLFGFFYSLWKRNVLYGLILINIGTLMKIVVSLLFGQKAGTAAIAPSISSLLAINLIYWLIWWRVKSSAGKESG